MKEAQRENLKKNKQDFLKLSPINNIDNGYSNRNVLQEKNFNYDSNKQYLEPNRLSYQNKNHLSSLKNAKTIEESLIKIQVNSNKKSVMNPRISDDCLASKEKLNFEDNYYENNYYDNNNQMNINDTSNIFSIPTNQNYEYIPDVYNENKLQHDYNDDLAMIEYSSKISIHNLNKHEDNRNDQYMYDKYGNPKTLHLYRKLGSEEISKIKPENRNRMAMRETQNPFINFFKSILQKFGCSEN